MFKLKYLWIIFTFPSLKYINEHNINLNDSDLSFYNIASFLFLKLNFNGFKLIISCINLVVSHKFFYNAVGLLRSIFIRHHFSAYILRFL